jgi:GH24 family phage-related lysozyme (muramidase)
LRQSGVHTQSKSIREIYKQVTNELLREFNSSMAMGTLKQINNDAKEIETMLQSTSQLEDWVKAKLNLAGEYLDDVYHHLDHFGSNDNSVDENYYDDKESLRMSRQMRFMNQSPEKKYWVTPDGNIVDAEGDHEDWIKKHDPKLRGSTLIDTYENAIKKGYIRVVYDVGTGFITLSNLNNYDFRKEGSSAHNIPSVNEKQMSSIKEFVKDKKIRMVATGKGNLLHDFGGLDESIAKEVLNYKKLKEGWKDLAIAGAIGLSGMVGNLQANPTSQSTQKSQSVTKSVSRPSLDSSFIDYIKTVENDGKVGFDKNRKLWFPHKSVEGGSDTIAYGHKIQKGEDFSNGITDDRANELLKKDLQNAVNQVYRELGNVNLTKKQLEMFTDFVFNLGTLKKFPEFTRAALNNDLNNMKLQYKRYANKKPLKGRNAAFFSRFLNEYFGFNYAIG